MTAYYNEFDPFAAAWLRELIKEGLIADGEVDERSIKDVAAADLRGFAQVHFFAGIGGWSYALRLANWPDDKPVWTGSCPCQPFSAAGKQQGISDARHLWPDMLRLIAECSPSVVFGEQVASRLGRGWLAGVRADLEALGYEVGAADLCAAGVGAPHIRQRLYWVAYANGGIARDGELQPSGEYGQQPQNSVAGERLAHHHHPRLEGWQQSGRECEAECASGPGGLDGGVGEPAEGRRGSRRTSEEIPGGLARSEIERSSADSGLHDSTGSRQQPAREGSESETRDEARLCGFEQGRSTSGGGLEHPASDGREQRRPAPGQWSLERGCGFIPCADGKARRIEPSIFPLAHGVSNRVGLLRGAGNAIVPQVAAEFIRAAAL